MTSSNLVFGIYPETQEMDIPDISTCDKCQHVFTDYYKFLNYEKYCDGIRNEFPCRFCEVMRRPEKTRRWHEKVRLELIARNV